MKVKGSYRPNALEYEVLHNGTANIRLYENIVSVEEQGNNNGMSGFIGWEFDRYTIQRPHSEWLETNVRENISRWLEFAKAEEIKLANRERVKTLRQLISETGDDYSMRAYASMSGVSLAELPAMRKEWLAELRSIDGLTLSLDDVKAEAIAETKKLLANALETPIDFNGKKYSVTLEKQNLLSAQLGLFGLNSQAGSPMPLHWNATGEPCEIWEFPNLLALSNAIAAHVTPLAQLQREAEVEINDCDTEVKVRAAVAKYAIAISSGISG